MSTLSKEQLYQMAKERHIKGRSKMTKAELLVALQKTKTIRVKHVKQSIKTTKVHKNAHEQEAGGFLMALNPFAKCSEMVKSYVPENQQDRMKSMLNEYERLYKQNVGNISRILQENELLKYGLGYTYMLMFYKEIFGDKTDCDDNILAFIIAFHNYILQNQDENVKQTTPPLKSLNKKIQQQAEYTLNEINNLDKTKFTGYSIMKCFHGIIRMNTSNSQIEFISLSGNYIKFMTNNILKPISQQLSAQLKNTHTALLQSNKQQNGNTTMMLLKNIIDSMDGTLDTSMYQQLIGKSSEYRAPYTEYVSFALLSNRLNFISKNISAFFEFSLLQTTFTNQSQLKTQMSDAMKDSMHTIPTVPTLISTRVQKSNSDSNKFWNDTLLTLDFEHMNNKQRAFAIVVYPFLLPIGLVVLLSGITILAIPLLLLVISIYFNTVVMPDINGV